MPIIRYAVVEYIQTLEYPHYKTIKIFAKKDIAEKHAAELSSKSLYERLTKNKPPYHDWDYDWTERSKKLFFQYLDEKNVFPKNNFGTTDVADVKKIMIKMLEDKELDSFRFQHQSETVSEWLEIEDYFVKPLKQF